MGYVQKMIREKLTAHPGSELVIMNMGGIENPSKAKDFKEWDLFDIDARRIFPEAKIYMGDSLSPEMKAITRSSIPLRESDLTPSQAAEIIARSHYILSGRYHGKIFAKAFGISYDEAISTFKCVAEEESCLDPKRAIDSIQYIKDFLESNRNVEGIPSEWSEDQRNSAIVTVNQLYPDMDIPFIQGMDNGTLYRRLLQSRH